MNFLNSILFLCKIKAHTSVLNGICKELHCIDCNLETFTKDADTHWRNCFNIKKLEGKSNKFTNTIETNGKAMSTHFIRPKNMTDAPSIDISSFDRVISTDPGRKNIYYGADKSMVK